MESPPSSKLLKFYFSNNPLNSERRCHSFANFSLPHPPSLWPNSQSCVPQIVGEQRGEGTITTPAPLSFTKYILHTGPLNQNHSCLHIATLLTVSKNIY